MNTSYDKNGLFCSRLILQNGKNLHYLVYEIIELIQFI